MIQAMSALISDTAISLLAAVMVAAAWNWQLQVPIWIWIVLLTLQFLINDGMMKKGVSMNLYLLFNLAAVSVVLFAVLLRAVWEHDSLAVILGMGICCTGGHCAAAAYHLPGSNQLVWYVDILIGMFGLYLYFAYQTMRDYDEICMVLTAAALLLDFFSINRLRTGDEAGFVIQGAGAGGKLLLLLIFCGSLLLTGGIVGLASGQIHSIVDICLYLLRCIWTVVSAIGGIFGKILTAILLFLVMLFPATPPQARETLWMQMQERTKETAEEAGVVLPAWVMWLIFGALLFLLLGMILYQFRGIKTQRKQWKKNKRRIVRKSHLFLTLKERWKYFAEKVNFQWNYQRYKKTPQGLLILAERMGKRHGCGRLTNESPGAYLRRLDPELQKLAKMLDEYYYAGIAQNLTEEEYQDYAVRISSIGKVK